MAAAALVGAGLAGCSGSGAPAPSSPAPRAMTSAATPTPAPSSAAADDVLEHVDWARVLPMRCAPIPVVVDQVLVADVTGDGVPDALVKARCDAAAGSPPSSLFAYAGGERGPTPLGPLVTERDDVLLGPVTVAGGLVSVKATSWSGPDVPRCCPDVQRELHWRWDGNALAPVP